MKQKKTQTIERWAWSVNPKKVKSAVIARILEEIKNDRAQPTSYNRFYNRHMRS